MKLQLLDVLELFVYNMNAEYTVQKIKVRIQILHFLSWLKEEQ